MDADKIKEFFLFHFEKMILVVVIAASGFLIYQGVKLPNFLEQEQPEKLSSEATRVKSDIDVNHNDAIIPERNPTFDIVEETIKLYTAVEPSAYKLDRTWEGKSDNTIVRRQDPVLISPRSLVVQGVATAIAIRGKSTTDDENYLLAKLEDAEPLERVEAKPERAPRSRSRRRGRGGGDMEMEMGMGMDEMEMEMDMGMEMDMEMSMGGSGSTRKFDSKFDFGKRPTATEDKRYPVPSVGWFIAGTAVIPHKELYEAFEMALGDADQYLPGRDTPFYYNLEVQRADVTDKSVDELVEADWLKTVQNDKKPSLWDRELYTKLAAYQWSGFAPEIVPADYRDESITLWIPPVLLDDYRDFATHPLIPMISQSEIKKLANADEEEDEIIEFDIDMDGGTLMAPGERSRGGEMGGMEMDMMDEMDMSMDYDEMGGMMMGMGRAMMGRRIETDPVNYKLLRFYDFAGFRNSPQPGRKYVYRIRYSVNDPNFPFSHLLQPKSSSLAPEVIGRVQALMATAAETQSRAGLFERWSEWSEPSEPISLPTLEHHYAGPVTRGTVNTWKVGNKQVEYARDLPTAKIVASKYDLETGARIPFRLDVTEGSVLSHKAEFADVVDPITLAVKKLPEAEIVSGTTIVDIDGGTELSIAQGLTSPGLMLLYDNSGELTVTDEVSDQEYYRIYSYADERGE